MTAFDDMTLITAGSKGAGFRSSGPESIVPNTTDWTSFTPSWNLPVAGKSRFRCHRSLHIHSRLSSSPAGPHDAHRRFPLTPGSLCS